MPKTSKPVVLLLSIAILALSAGCTETADEPATSYASTEELQESLIQPTDLPGWNQETVADDGDETRITENHGKSVKAEGENFCDPEYVAGLIFSNVDLMLTVNSRARRTCGGMEENMEKNLGDETFRRDTVREALTTQMAPIGVSVANLTYELTDLGADKNVHVYKVRADMLPSNGGALVYTAYEVTVYSPRVVTTMMAAGWGVEFPVEEVARLTALIQARLPVL